MKRDKVVWRQVIEYHPTIGYRFVPGLKARIDSAEGGYLIRVNESGFRCRHEFEPGKKSGTRRVLLFGDSFTAGDGVSNDKRYGDVLEKLIPNLEVYNFGLPATGTDQHYLAYKEYAANIDHDLLIIAVYLENIRRNISHSRYFMDEHGQMACFAKPYFELENGELALKNTPVPKRPLNVESMSAAEKQKIYCGTPHSNLNMFSSKLDRYTHKLGLSPSIRRHLLLPPFPEYSSTHHPAWSIMRTILVEWINGHCKPVLLLIIPPDQYIRGLASPKAYQSRFQEVACATGCLLYDPVPDLLMHSIEERETFRLHDYHYSPAGHAALAALLAPRIERIFLEFS